MRPRVDLSAAILPLVCVVLACTQSARERQVRDVADEAPLAMYEVASPAPEVAASRVPAEPPSLAAIQAALKLIRTATLSVEVADFDSAAATVGEIARTSGGYVADSRRSRDERGASRGVVTVRVPADRFAPTLAALRELGEVQDEAQSTQDITKAYADLEIRVAIKREAAQRLREILGTRTGRLSDVLEVERELSRVVEEIERMEGERRFYDQQVAMSTITATLYEPGAERGDGALAPVGDALRHSVRALATSLGVIISGTAYLLPWLLLAVLGWFGTKRTRAAIKRRRASG